MRADPTEYAALDLHAHVLLTDVPLHDVWTLELPGGPPGLGIAALRERIPLDGLARSNPAVRLLFAVRRGLGRLCGWDPERSGGPFQSVYTAPRESIEEVRNATVHAFSVQALVEEPGGYRFYWAIHVRPVGRITKPYMALIDPFRRWIVYPAVLRHIRRTWERDVGVSSPAA